MLERIFSIKGNTILDITKKFPSNFETDRNFFVKALLSIMFFHIRSIHKNASFFTNHTACHTVTAGAVRITMSDTGKKLLTCF